MTGAPLVQVWTYEGRVAFVLSVTERNLPVAPEKLPGVYKMLMHIMDPNSEGIVRTWMVGPPSLSAKLPCINNEEQGCCAVNFAQRMPCILVKGFTGSP